MENIYMPRHIIVLVTIKSGAIASWELRFVLPFYFTLIVKSKSDNKILLTKLTD